jgi:uncharacterized membrane protein
MDNLVGMDFNTWRFLTGIGTVGALCLYGYKIRCLIDLMKSQSDRVLEYNRIVYAALIVFLPLGIGAWLYDFVVNEKKYSPLFLYPFCVVSLVFIYTMYHVLPNATQFNMDYVGW